MLTMTVMQHERGAVGGYSKEAVEDKDDVLSCLRHLHRTLQECHWRVHSVDHALCAQGNKGLDGQNHAGNDHSLQYQTGEDHSLQNQPREGCNLQDETGRDNRLENEAVYDDNPEDETEIKQNLENQLRKIREQTKDSHVQDNPEEEHNHQSEIEEEYMSQDLSQKDHYHQKPTQEKNSPQNIDREDGSLLLQDKDTSIDDLCSHSKEYLPSQPTEASDLQKVAMKDHTELHYPRPDHYIHNQTKKENEIKDFAMSTYGLDCLNSTHKQHYIGIVGHDGVDEDSATISSPGIMNATVEPQLISRNSRVSDASAVPYTMTDYIQHQHLHQNLRLSTRIAKGGSSRNCCQSSEVRYRPGHTEESVVSKVLYEEEMDLLKSFRTSDVSFENQEDKTTDGEKVAGEISPVDPVSEVTQKMDVIWEAIKNLQSHFLALHSSIVDSSSYCLTQETNKSLDDSVITLLKDKGVKPSDLHEEHHARCEDEAAWSHQTTRETTQHFQPFSECPSYKKTVLRAPSQPVCHTLSRSCTRSCTPHQQPANDASLRDSTAYRGTFFQGWQGSCLFIGVVLLLLLLLLFLASCLLLVLPVVSVSVRTAGGLPAF